MSSCPKIKRAVDTAYLAYIRSQPCLVWGCQNKAEAHHDPSVGAFGSDYKTVCLCRQHHSECHTIGKDTFQKRFNLNFDKERIRLLKEYIKKLKANFII